MRQKCGIHWPSWGEVQVTLHQTLLESGFARHCHQEQKMLMTSASFVQRVSPLKFLKWREKKPFKTRLYAAKVAPLRNRVAQQNTSS